VEIVIGAASFFISATSDPFVVAECINIIKSRNTVNNDNANLKRLDWRFGVVGKGKRKRRALKLPHPRLNIQSTTLQ
jgi:hypothetical protein